MRLFDSLSIYKFSLWMWPAGAHGFPGWKASVGRRASRSTATSELSLVLKISPCHFLPSRHCSRGPNFPESPEAHLIDKQNPDSPKGWEKVSLGCEEFWKGCVRICHEVDCSKTRAQITVGAGFREAMGEQQNILQIMSELGREPQGYQPIAHL